MRSKSKFRLSARLVELGVASLEGMSALREIAIVELPQPRALEIDHGGTSLAPEERAARGYSWRFAPWLSFLGLPDTMGRVTK